MKKADECALSDREAIVDLMMEMLAPDNYIPNQKDDLFRTALWREYLRYQGKDFSEFYSEIPVTVQGGTGEERERFVDAVRSALAGLELRPDVTFEPRPDHGPSPQLVIRGEVVVTGGQSRRGVEAAVRQSMSDW